MKINKNNAIHRFYIFFLALLLVAFVQNSFATDVEKLEYVELENVEEKDNEKEDNKILDNEISPYTDEIFENIKSQILNEKPQQSEKLRNDAINILNGYKKNFQNDFGGVVYSINHSFDIGVSFIDENNKKYFKPISKNISVNFNKDNVSLETKYFKKNTGVNRKISFVNKKNKLKKAFYALDDSRNGLVVMLPDFGENEIQSIVMCPRTLQNKDNDVRELVPNGWNLSGLFDRTFSQVSIVVNELTPVDISAGVSFSKDCNKKGILNTSNGTMVSAKALYDVSYQDEFSRLNKKDFKLPQLFSLKSGVTYKKDSVLKEASKRIAYEIREYNLEKDVKFPIQNAPNTTLKPGMCYILIGVSH